jgi:hypothetical protein
MKFLKYILLFSILFASNSYSQSSKVVFFRTNKTYTGISPRIYLNDSSIVKMKTGTFKVIELPSKTIEFTSHLPYFYRPLPYFFKSLGGITRFKIELKPDSVYYVNFHITRYEPIFELISLKEMKELSSDSFFVKNLQNNNLTIK